MNCESGWIVDCTTWHPRCADAEIKRLRAAVADAERIEDEQLDDMTRLLLQREEQRTRGDKADAAAKRREAQLDLALAVAEEMKQRAEAAEAQLHYCPDCGEACKLCECWNDALDEAEKRWERAADAQLDAMQQMIAERSLADELAAALRDTHSCCEHGDRPDGSWSPLVEPAIARYEAARRGE